MTSGEMAEIEEMGKRGETRDRFEGDGRDRWGAGFRIPPPQGAVREPALVFPAWDVGPIGGSGEEEEPLDGGLPEGGGPSFISSGLGVGGLPS